MPSLAPLRDALEERLTARSVGVAFVFAAGFHHFFGASPTQVAATMLVAAVVGLGDAAGDAYDVREAVAHGWNGALAFAGTGALYALGEDPPLWFPLLFGSLGAWFLADAIQTARHEGVVERARDGRAVYRDYVARQVHETLDERPRTRRELHGALAADDETVDAAVADLRERGVVVEAGSELRLDESEESLGERVASRLGSLARRIARPVTLEFRGKSDEPGSESVKIPDTDSETDAFAGADRDTANRDATASGTDDDRERELSRE